MDSWLGRAREEMRRRQEGAGLGKKSPRKEGKTAGLPKSRKKSSVEELWAALTIEEVL